jgi:hypothetical protein
MEVDEAVAALMDDPQGFLGRNALTIAGGSALSSGLRIWYLARTNNGTATVATSGPGWSGTRKVLAWQATVTADTSNRFLRRYNLGTTDVAEFRAWYVGMREIGEDVATTHLLLPATGGPDLMLTSQLTGCTFGYGSQLPGSGCLASHIRPAGSGDGRRAPGALTPLGKRALLSAVRGPLGAGATILETSGQLKVSVVGQRVGGTWRFFKQVLDDATQKITVTVQGV